MRITLSGVLITVLAWDYVSVPPNQSTIERAYRGIASSEWLQSVTGEVRRTITEVRPEAASTPRTRPHEQSEGTPSAVSDGAAPTTDTPEIEVQATDESALQLPASPSSSPARTVPIAAHLAVNAGDEIRSLEVEDSGAGQMESSGGLAPEQAASAGIQFGVTFEDVMAAIEARASAI